MGQQNHSPRRGRLSPDNQLLVLECEPQWGGIRALRRSEVPDSVILGPVCRLRRPRRMVLPPDEQRPHGLKTEPKRQPWFYRRRVDRTCILTHETPTDFGFFGTRAV